MNIFFTKKSQKDYKSIQEYLKLEWGEKVVLSFAQRVIDFLDILEKFPEIGVLEVVGKQLRSFQLTNQVRLFYRIRNQKIIILSFFDVRQNPNKKPK